MAKQDVLDAINATIAPNNIKGITAESLNNVLTMMAENAGEGGSGDGALRVIVPDLAAGFLELGEFSLTSWGEMKTMIETNMPGTDLSEMDATVSAMIAHNAKVAQQLIEKSKAGQGVSVILDQNLFTQACFNVLLQIDPSAAVIYEDLVLGSSQFASYSLEYAKFTPEGEAEFGISEGASLVLSPVRALEGSGDIVHYPESVLLNLQLDGSIVFEKIEEEQPSSGVVTFYFPQDTSSPTSEETENNKAAYASFMSAKEKSIVKIYSRNEELGSVPFMTNVEEDNGEMVIILTDIKEENGTLVPLKFVAMSDGYFNHL